LLRTFKRWHDYLHGNQQMRHDKAFWQLLYLIFCKILDEQQSSRLVGATEDSPIFSGWGAQIDGSESQGKDNAPDQAIGTQQSSCDPDRRT
jgi:hypothetical protein